jgi:hypothetical protein
MFRKILISLTLSTMLLSATEIKFENLNSVIDSQRTLLTEKLNDSNEKYIISITPVFQHKEDKGECQGGAR